MQADLSFRPSNIYEALGAQVFTNLVEHFYDSVSRDAPFYAIYPPDLEESKRTLRLFLMQFFGGPDDYSQERGHPRLRMRHAPFAIGIAERDTWLRHMNAALEAEVSDAQIRQTMWEYFVRHGGFYDESAALKTENSPASTCSAIGQIQCAVLAKMR